jgi:Ulp1 family protease
MQIQIHPCTPLKENGYDCGVHLLANEQKMADCTDTDLTGVNIGKTTVIGLVDVLEQRLTNQSLSFAERLRAEIAQDIRRRAASAL